MVLNRPWAFVQWLRNSTIKENYVLMSEPDHLWMKPMPNIMKGEKPAAFPFFYIEPSRASYTGFVQRFTGPLTQQQLEEIPPIGLFPSTFLLCPFSLLTFIAYYMMIQNGLSNSKLFVLSSLKNKLQTYQGVVEQYYFLLSGNLQS